uniref:Predicted protein n=1 Tax=Physcomitrium patens TaxID=3218 RepID=A9U555_PHYPA
MGQKGFWRAVKGHPYRFTIYSCNRLYSNSQKSIDCLNISESPYYLLQSDIRNSKAIIERKLWQSKHCKQWSIKLINFMERIFQELNRFSEKKMVELFGLATILETRDHITSITDHYGNSWEVFSHALKDEYFLKDVDRVTKKLFVEWIEWPNKNLQATELLREFERQYSQLSKVEKLTLEPNKVDLFLQAADGELQEKLELLLEDKEEDKGLTTK